MSRPAGWRPIAWLLPGCGTLAFLLALTGLSMGGLLRQAPEINFSEVLADPYIRQVTLFTFWQAVLSTLLSVGLAIPVARALARRRRFLGRSLLLRLFSLALVTPAIVAIFGIVAIHGRQGWLNQVLGAIGLDGGNYLYGLTGILIAHVFFNLPLASRVLLQSLETIPPETWRLAAQLGMRPRDVFRFIDWPVIRQALPGLAGLIFMLCFTSFAVVLTLGGGPRSTTLEVAVYQALKFEFDLGKAVLLALLQLGLCSVIALGVLRFGRVENMISGERRFFERPDRRTWGGQLVDGGALIGAVGLVVLPLSAVAAAGFNDKLWRVLADPGLWRAAGQSGAIALTSAALSLVLGWGILTSSRALRHRLFHLRSASLLEVSGSITLIVPPFVLAAGLFVLLRQWSDVFSLGFYLVILINALMALPFVLRILGSAMHQAAEEDERLCQSLGIAGRRRLTIIDWPKLRRPAALALAIAATLSLGDLSVIALFGTQDFQTLPLLLYQRMGSYRLDEAAVVAAFLAVFCLLLFVGLERLFGAPTKDQQL
ncbi:MAG: thiamine/thiamine pyrophosphate ABC transporter permease [Pseudomonadota bacterium]